MILALLCVVATVTDADTIRCDDGTRIRIAGINARERDGSCNSEPCPAMRHERAKPIVERMVLHKRLACEQVGRSYNRVVARCTLPDGRDLSCAIIATGAAVRWDRYWREYGMEACR